MGFKPYWDVFKLSRFRKELSVKSYAAICLSC